MDYADLSRYYIDDRGFMCYQALIDGLGIVTFKVYAINDDTLEFVMETDRIF